MTSAGKTLGSVAQLVGGRLMGQADAVVTDVVHDSRQAGPGALFVAIRGERHDGHDHAGHAAARGAAALLVEHPVDVDLPQVVVADTRAVMGRVAAEVHGNPSHAVKVVGVTGTNGKTTVAHFVESILRRSGVTTGLLGTVRTRIAGEDLPSIRTTPEATDFQRLLAEMRERRVEMAAVEVSSHALALGRVTGTRFAVAAFTNLSQDHLDFHGDMDRYRRAKESLFRDYEVGTAVINVDDQVGEAIASWCRPPVVRVGSRGEVKARSVRGLGYATRFVLEAAGESAEVTIPAVGRFNVDNAVLAAACSLATGLEFEAVVSGLETLGPVPGRFELVSGGDPVRVIVDYAHTPDGVRQAVGGARAIATGRVIAVLGAGGDRDRGKRPLMGEAGAEADLLVVTSDNPRSEDPSTIIEDVMSGVPEGRVAVVEVDRRRAIEHAVAVAQPGDLVLVLGKGHETGQEIAGRIHPFDDREVAAEVLASLRERSAKQRPDSGSIEP